MTPNEDVWVLGFDSMSLQSRIRKVSKIERDYHVGSRDNCRRQYMPVVLVGQGQRGDQALIIRHQAVTHTSVHQGARPLQPLPFQIGTVFKKISDPLFLNLKCPSGLKRTRDCQMHQQIAERCRVKHTRIVERGERRHGLISHVKFLRLCG